MIVAQTNWMISKKDSTFDSGQRKSQRKLYWIALFLTSPEFITN